MAKTRSLSKHSRAARRATSPSINTDKSLKEVSLPRASAAASSSAAAPASAPPSQQHQLRPSVLAVHRSAAVQKKKTSRPVRKRQLSARARRRHERGLEMAEAVGERTVAKVQRSVGRQRAVNARRKAWDDVNKLAATTGADAANPFDALGGGDNDEGEGADVETGDEDVDAAKNDAAPALPQPDDDQDEIL
ncbi:alb1 domain-containing protein [Hirsutella rhossiliensis]|uniref:Alb1 domain-containing protein n=1 Tax=Hirsutella rhossiliensis TaxID=111463 RepID=A0A9P8MLB2_9HYPO|nr:alb1 domain-containing protein [Hirsutella rhossiliensis]KAH0957099.1 alb1 domain-containing protein [Hirsutella rhossiliensis]